jgi:hypothetical protein
MSVRLGIVVVDHHYAEGGKRVLAMCPSGRGRWPWDDAYQGVRGGQPVLGPREPPERRKRIGLV